MTRCIELTILSSLINFTSSFQQSSKLYPHLERYNLQNNDPNKFCEGYICEHSGLTETTVTTALNMDNTLRNSYALSRNISNLYMLEWYPVLQYWAQDKANLCLPPTEDEFYDFAVIQKYGIPKYDAEYKDACQVVIVSQPIKAKHTTPQQMKERITDYIYQNRLRHFKRNAIILSSSESESEEDTTNDHKPVSDVHFKELVAEMTGVLDQFYVELPRKSQKEFAKALLLNGSQWGLNRKQASQAGCGYTLRLNETHYIDHLVCLYCVFRFQPKGLHYTTTRGAPCTNCNYYKTEYPWRCGKRYQNLCVASVTDENRKSQIVKSACPKEGNRLKVKSKKTRFVNFEKLISPIEVENYHQEEQQSRPANQVTKFLDDDKKKEDRSLMEELAKAKQFSYRKYPQNSDNCDLCKVLLVFAACLMCVSLISLSYVVYILKRDENK